MKKSDNLLDQDIRVIFKAIARNRVVRKIFLFLLIMMVSMGTGGIITAYDEMPGCYYRYADADNRQKVMSDTELPERFDLREYGLVSTVRDQGEYGTCWAMAAVGSMETQLLAKTGKEILLSPWHLAYFGSVLSETSMANGGDSVMATSLLTDGVGPVSEDKVPYGSGDIDREFQNDNEYTVTDVYNLKPYIYGTFFDTDTIKKLLYEKNSISITMAFIYDYYDYTAASYYCPDSIRNNHSVLIVGWDDNYSKENFSFSPENDGAWIVRNNRGNEWGDGGFFYLSYYDVNLSASACYKIADDSQKIYGADNRNWITSISTDKEQKSCTGYMASVFLAEDDAKISSVSFYTIEPGVEYELCIYTDLKDENNPASGWKSDLTVGKNNYCGYMTVELDKSVEIKKGESFSVVVKIINPSSPYTVPVESSGYYYEKGASMTNYIDAKIKSESYKDNSFISNNGMVWKKIKNTIYEHKKQNYEDFLELSYADGEKVSECIIGGVCIKAFAELA